MRELANLLLGCIDQAFSSPEDLARLLCELGRAITMTENRGDYTTATVLAALKFELARQFDRHRRVGADKQ